MPRYYCFFSRHPVSHSRLYDILWPNLGDERAKPNLIDAFYRLSNGLKQDGATNELSDYLYRKNETVVFNKSCPYDCDVEAFEAIVLNASTETDLPTLEAAFRLYRGPFLDHFKVQNAPEFDAWVDNKREALAEGYKKLLHLLSLRYLTNGNWPKAIEHLEHLRTGLQAAFSEEDEAQNWLDLEVIYGLLMICYVLTSQLDLAKRVYHEYEQLLRANMPTVAPRPGLGVPFF